MLTVSADDDHAARVLCFPRVCTRVWHTVWAGKGGVIQKAIHNSFHPQNFRFLYLSNDMVIRYTGSVVKKTIIIPVVCRC